MGKLAGITVKFNFLTLSVKRRVYILKHHRSRFVAVACPTLRVFYFGVLSETHIWTQPASTVCSAATLPHHLLTDTILIMQHLHLTPA